MIKKLYLFGALLMFVISSACAQTTKKMVFDGAAEDRNLTGFTSINVTNAFDVYISQGTEDAVAVSKSDASGTSYIITNVSGGVLYISYRYKGWSWSSLRNNKLKAYITVKNLEKLSVSGACNVSFDRTCDSDGQATSSRDPAHMGRGHGGVCLCLFSYVLGLWGRSSSLLDLGRQ